MQIRILSIGDICAVSAQRCLAKIAKCDGVEITCGVMCLPDGELSNHAEAILNDLPVYTFDYCADGSVRLNTEENCSFSNIISMFDWDYVTVNQSIEKADRQETYFPYINNIADCIKEKCPKAQLVINEPWAKYENHNELFRTIRSSCISVAENTRIKIVFPVGEAWQAVRNAYPELELTNNGLRSNRMGDFVCSAVWYEVLTGNSIEKTITDYLL